MVSSELLKTNIENLLKNTLSTLKTDLQNNRFKYVTEGDLQSRLYSIPSNQPLCQEIFKDKVGNPVSKVHAEYPRLFLDKRKNILHFIKSSI